MTDLATHTGRAGRASSAAAAGAATTTTTDDRAGRNGFRPSARRRTRIAAGVALGAAAVAVNLILYSGLDQRSSVVQVVRDVPAGALLSDADVRTVEADVDSSVPVVGNPADVIGRYAAVRLVAGSLLTDVSLRTDPLVTRGSAVVAVRVPDGALPAGVRERVPVQLVIPPATSTGDEQLAPATIDGRVVGLPATSESAPGTLSLSVEVEARAAATVAAADDVRVVLVEPGADPATQVDTEAPADDIDEAREVGEVGEVGE